MLQALKLALRLLLNDIDSGNSNINEDLLKEIIYFIRKFTEPKLSTLEAADYLGVCKATLKNYVDKGLIPEGEKIQGAHGLFWDKSDLDKYLEKKNLS